MFRIVRFGALLVCLLALTLCSTVPMGHAGPFDKLKQKVKEKTDEATGKAGDKATGDADDAAGGKRKDAGDKSGSGSGKPGAASGGTAKLSAVSTKFDYVPGDSVIFTDDFTQDDLGEFPARWRLNLGTFETAEMGGERWLRCAGADGTIRMKMPNTLSLPEFWTLEFDYYDEAGSANGLTVRGLANGDNVAWEVVFPLGTTMAFRSGAMNGSAPYEGAGSVAGRHHIMFMGRGKALKAYVDRQRAVSIPEIDDAHGIPLGFDFRLWAPDKPMITNVRFAAGCRPAKDMLAEGKLVTYGIHFESGSDVIQPESAPILRQVAAYLTSKPDVKLKITGHTDNVGKPAANLDLSKRRAAAVAGALSTQFSLAADRFNTDGKGDTQPLSSNAMPEGRAMNRRVEFTRLKE